MGPSGHGVESYCRPMIAVSYDAGSGFQFATIRQPQILKLPFVLDCRFSPFEHCGQLAIPALGPWGVSVWRRQTGPLPSELTPTCARRGGQRMARAARARVLDLGAAPHVDW
jgi:hypothetical protein